LWWLLRAALVRPEMISCCWRITFCISASCCYRVARSILLDANLSGLNLPESADSSESAVLSFGDVASANFIR
jgi:hypothetical protein